MQRQTICSKNAYQVSCWIFDVCFLLKSWCLFFIIYFFPYPSSTISLKLLIKSHKGESFLHTLLSLTRLYIPNTVWEFFFTPEVSLFWWFSELESGREKLSIYVVFQKLWHWILPSFCINLFLELTCWSSTILLASNNVQDSKKS